VHEHAVGSLIDVGQRFDRGEIHGDGRAVERELLKGPHRFNELAEALPGISAHTLTNRLRKFETHGLLTRTAYAEIPPRVVYELTPLGEALRPVLDAMNSWALTVPDEAFAPSE
jgi:DNA-binding HxlR family transcriptional regulator